jgi:hypothetical protein
MMFEEMLETAEHSAGDRLDEVAAGEYQNGRPQRFAFWEQ